ncbi:uncharacterized protein LOC111697022 [Eurytemora carolleeae]|uniref:uncharacterized protein LOC111697022 n=1 Tax=Eurytemora carolleeae TaxID=1294199 RepID=UPI000C793C6B|nr:uncharacterized protein LOC111697022 [Eurytemora carolleeae]|eukprot:XP_023322659.1 uncharacterized protein LOC111697022 [Eurytemora affinis]
MAFGTVDDNFLGTGVVVGFAIIVPACLLSYILGANISLLEIFINLVGGVLYVAVGAVTIQTYTYSGYSDHDSTGIALGALAIVTGCIFLVDFLFVVKDTKFT